eukprot:8919130-Pyramimonas_sp.AAC.1
MSSASAGCTQLLRSPAHLQSVTDQSEYSQSTVRVQFGSPGEGLREAILAVRADEAELHHVERRGHQRR